MDAARAPQSPQEARRTLSDRDRRILEFERQWWKYAGAKEQAIRDLFEMSGTRYYQILNGLIDDPEALAADPCWLSGCDGCARPASAPGPRDGSESSWRPASAQLPDHSQF